MSVTACQLAMDQCDDRLCAEIATGLVRVARERGTLTVLPFALNCAATHRLFGGEFGVAEELIADVPIEALDEMVILSVEGGHVAAMCRLLDAGARVDRDPAGREIPLGHACWRGRVEMARELVARGATLTFRDGGSALGAALHGSRHCHDPEGGPSMRTLDEIPAAPYAEIVRRLLAAGAPVPDRIGENGPRATTLIADLGIDLPA